MTSNIKMEYKTPCTKQIASNFHGILCQSVLEPIEEGGGHDW